MKKSIILLFLVIGAFLTVKAQGINYQTILRDAQGVVTNHQVDVLFNVYQGEVLVYTENQSTQSNQYGLVNLVIGEINPQDWEIIDWSSRNQSLEVMMDFGSGFVNFGKHDFQAVPYALQATQMSINDLTDVDLSNPDEGDVIKFEGGEWQPSGDEDNQQLFLDGNVLSITNGNSVNLNEIVVGGDDWGDQKAETDLTLTGDGTALFPIGIARQGAQMGNVLKWDGATWFPGPDNDMDAQELALAGNWLSITNGNSVLIPGADGDITEVAAGTGLSGGGVEGSVEISARNGEALWNANKLMGNSISSKAPDDGNVLVWDGAGAKWEPSAVQDDGDWEIYWDGEEYSLEAIYDVNTTKDMSCTSLSATYATIGNTLTAGKGQFWKNSTLSDPHIDLLETSSTDYTRLRMRSYESSNYWDLASRPGTSSLSARVNFYFSSTGDVMVLRGNGNMTIAGTLTQNSDQRLKTDIRPLQGSLERVLSLTGYNFRWKDEKMDQSLQTGLLAQQVQIAFPSLVLTDEETGILSVNYNAFIAVLIEAIKEQESKIADRDVRMNELEARLNKLEEQVLLKTNEQ